MLSPLNTAVMTLAAKYHADGRRPYSDLIAADLNQPPGVVFDAIAELADTGCLTKSGEPTHWGLYQAGLPVCPVAHATPAGVKE